MMYAWCTVTFITHSTFNLMHVIIIHPVRVRQRELNGLIVRWIISADVANRSSRPTVHVHTHTHIYIYIRPTRSDRMNGEGALSSSELHITLADRQVVSLTLVTTDAELIQQLIALNYLMAWPFVRSWCHENDIACFNVPHFHFSFPKWCEIVAAPVI